MAPAAGRARPRLRLRASAAPRCATGAVRAEHARFSAARQRARTRYEPPAPFGPAITSSAGFKILTLQSRIHSSQVFQAPIADAALSLRAFVLGSGHARLERRKKLGSQPGGGWRAPTFDTDSPPLRSVMNGETPLRPFGTPLWRPGAPRPTASPELDRPTAPRRSRPRLTQLSQRQAPLWFRSTQPSFHPE